MGAVDREDGEIAEEVAGADGAVGTDEQEAQQAGGDGGPGDDEDGEEGIEAAIRGAPVRPEQPEVDRHFASGHVPRRLCCPICARASLEEDPHSRAHGDHHDNGLAIVCRDYKEWVTSS